MAQVIREEYDKPRRKKEEKPKRISSGLYLSVLYHFLQYLPAFGNVLQSESYYINVLGFTNSTFSSTILIEFCEL